MANRMSESFVWRAPNGYMHSCRCGHRFVSSSMHSWCPKCNSSSFLLMTGAVGHKRSWAEVYARGEKFGYVEKMVEYRLSRWREDKPRHVYVSNVKVRYYVANLDTRRLYFVEPGVRVTALKALSVTLDPQQITKGIRILKKRLRMPMDRLMEVEYTGPFPDGLLGYVVYPQLALLTPYSPQLSLYLAAMAALKEMNHRRPFVTATDPVGILEELYHIKLGRSVLPLLERLSTTTTRNVRGNYDILASFFGIVRRLGLELARPFADPRLLEHGGNCIYVYEAVEWYLRASPSPKVAAERLLRAMHWGDLGVVIDTFRLAEEAGVDIREVGRVRDYAGMTRLHDEFSLQLEVKKDQELEGLYAPRVEEFKRLYEFRGEKYQILVPEELVEISEEGRAMSHCVGGYVRPVAHGETVILFLRTLDSERVGTLEVRDGRLIQAYGPCNQYLDREAQTFILGWAAERGIDTSYCRSLTVHEVVD